jgi:hypothetical protein
MSLTPFFGGDGGLGGHGYNHRHADGSAIFLGMAWIMSTKSTKSTTLRRRPQPAHRGRNPGFPPFFAGETNSEAHARSIFGEPSTR